MLKDAIIDNRYGVVNQYAQFNCSCVLYVIVGFSELKVKIMFVPREEEQEMATLVVLFVVDSPDHTCQIAPVPTIHQFISFMRQGSPPSKLHCTSGLFVKDRGKPKLGPLFCIMLRPFCAQTGKLHWLLVSEKTSLSYIPAW